MRAYSPILVAYAAIGAAYGNRFEVFQQDEKWARKWESKLTTAQPVLQLTKQHRLGHAHSIKGPCRERLVPHES
jgi:hypothetical protein